MHSRLSGTPGPAFPLFPVFLDVGGRPALVVGGGPVAAAKAESLQSAGADVTVVAPEFHERLRSGGFALVERAFRPADVEGKWFVVAAAPPAVNRMVREAADRRQIFVNVVDDGREASAFLGGVVRRGGVTVAVSTQGIAPALAGLLREALDALLPDELGRWLEVAAKERPAWKAVGIAHSDRRPLLLAALNRIYGERT